MSAVRKESEAKDNRRSKRERVMLAANLSFSNGTYSNSCVVTQLSSTGARLSLSSEVGLSEKMTVSIPQRNIECPARLIWRRGNQFAIAFLTQKHADGPEPPAVRVRELEDENKRLRALLTKLELRLKEMQQGY